MYKNFIDYLICPKCHGELNWCISEENENRVINAAITCKSCGEGYEVKDEIAVFLTNVLSRNDLWEKSSNGLEEYLNNNKESFDQLMNTPEEELSGADYWYKASYYEGKEEFKESSRMFSKAFEKIYTDDYIKGNDSQIDYIVQNIDKDQPIVDIASGKGYLVEQLLLKTDNLVIATDFSPTILMRNKAYYQFKGLYNKLSLFAFDARMTPFRNHSIHNLTSNLGLQNIENPGGITKEMHRITKGAFMCIMHFVNQGDQVHLDFFKEYGFDEFTTKENTIKVYNEYNWHVSVNNSYFANIKPTPVGEILKGAGIDGFPVEETVVEMCVVKGEN